MNNRLHRGGEDENVIWLPHNFLLTACHATKQWGLTVGFPLEVQRTHHHYKVQRASCLSPHGMWLCDFRLLCLCCVHGSTTLWQHWRHHTAQGPLSHQTVSLLHWGLIITSWHYKGQQFKLQQDSDSKEAQSLLGTSGHRVSWQAFYRPSVFAWVSYFQDIFPVRKCDPLNVWCQLRTLATPKADMRERVLQKTLLTFGMYFV